MNLTGMPKNQVAKHGLWDQRDQGQFRILWSSCLAAMLVSISAPVMAQEALRHSLAGNAAAEAMRRNLENRPYTVKSGDFRLLLTPSLGLDYNDNINSSEDGLDDFILKPKLQMQASMPVSQRNLLMLDIGIGYDYYFDHDDYSGLRLHSGSQISFDVFVKDFRFNFHDRFQYDQDSAGTADIANTGERAYFQNTIGLTVDWDLQDLVLTAGYDHLNYISQSSYYDYTTHATEMFLARAGLRVHPELTLGVEGSVAPTRYDENVLNENTSYSGGIYADYRPGKYFTLRPRFGYAIYDFRQTSDYVRAEDTDSWYADITVSHQPTDILSYSLSLGHEMRMGLQSDLVESTYVRPSISWYIFKNVSLQTGLFYEHGQQKAGQLTAEDNYDWYGGSINVSHQFHKHLRASLHYRLTFRSADESSREYTQNLVGILLTYTPR